MCIIGKTKLATLVDAPDKQFHLLGCLVLAQYIDNLFTDLYILYKIIIKSVKLNELGKEPQML